MFTLCSASVSALQIMFSDSLYEKYCKMGEQSHFQKGQIVGARSAATSLTKWPLHQLYPEQQFARLVTAYTDHGKTSSADRNCGRKPKLSERESRKLKRFGSKRPPLWSSGQSFWLHIQRSRVRFPALPDFLSSSGSGTGSTQPREVN